MQHDDGAERNGTQECANDAADPARARVARQVVAQRAGEPSFGRGRFGTHSQSCPCSTAGHRATLMPARCGNRI